MRARPLAHVLRRKSFGLCLLKLLLGLTASLAAGADVLACQSQESTKTEVENVTPEPAAVAVHPEADDAAIARRLASILEATEWFDKIHVEVNEGVVTLRGGADSVPHRDWAASLARKTEDVVAVVNNLVVREAPLLDLSPAWSEARKLLRDAIRALPLLLFGAFVFAVAFIVAVAAKRSAASIARRRVDSQLLTNVIANSIAFPILVLGTFAALRVSGLTQLAATVIGGTGLIGLIVGIAFRDIAENFLASILISAQRPFRVGDLIEVAGRRGYVQGVTLRGTILMTADGNHIQLSNATIYKSEIQNFTANTKERHSFTVGIGYDDDIAFAQGIALDVLQHHSAVLDDPEPLVLVTALGQSTVDLQAYYWIDIEKNSAMKVKSALLRLVKNTFMARRISMPDAAREIVFPTGVPVRMLSDREQPGDLVAVERERRREATDQATDTVVEAEGDLSSESATVEKQALDSRPMDDGGNLIADEAKTRPVK